MTASQNRLFEMSVAYPSLHTLNATGEAAGSVSFPRPNLPTLDIDVAKIETMLQYITVSFDVGHSRPDLAKLCAVARRQGTSRYQSIRTAIEGKRERQHDLCAIALDMDPTEPVHMPAIDDPTPVSSLEESVNVHLELLEGQRWELVIQAGYAHLSRHNLTRIDAENLAEHFGGDLAREAVADASVANAELIRNKLRPAPEPETEPDD